MSTLRAKKACSADLNSQRGASLVEYVLLLSLMCTVTFGTVQKTGDSAAVTFDTMQLALGGQTDGTLSKEETTMKDHDAIASSGSSGVDL